LNAASFNIFHFLAATAAERVEDDDFFSTDLWQNPHTCNPHAVSEGKKIKIK
jgi:hypothetical protein